MKKLIFLITIIFGINCQESTTNPQASEEILSYLRKVSATKRPIGGRLPIAEKQPILETKFTRVKAVTAPKVTPEMAAEVARILGQPIPTTPQPKIVASETDEPESTAFERAQQGQFPSDKLTSAYNKIVNEVTQYLQGKGKYPTNAIEDFNKAYEGAPDTTRQSWENRKAFINEIEKNQIKLEQIPGFWDRLKMRFRILKTSRTKAIESMVNQLKQTKIDNQPVLKDEDAANILQRSAVREQAAYIISNSSSHTEAINKLTAKGLIGEGSLLGKEPRKVANTTIEFDKGQIKTGNDYKTTYDTLDTILRDMPHGE